MCIFSVFPLLTLFVEVAAVLSCAIEGGEAELAFIGGLCRIDLHRGVALYALKHEANGE